MPGGTVCSIVTCRSNAKKAKQAQQQIRFFNFPSDPGTRRVWVQKCKRKDKFDPKNKRICSLHFKMDDYEDALYARLMNSVPVKLMKTAVPSINLPRGSRSTCQRKIETSTAVHPSLSRQQERYLKEERQELVEECFPCGGQQAEQLEFLHIKQEEIIQVINEKKEIDCLKRHLQALNEENELLKNRLLMHKNNEATLKSKCKDLEKQLNNINLTFEETAKVVFKDLLSASQIDLAIKKRRKCTLKSKCKDLEKQLNNINLTFEETAKVVFKDLLSASQIDLAIKKRRKVSRL